MSKINNVKLSSNKHINISVANTTIKQIMSSTNLPANTIIIAANGENGIDNNQFGILVTDINGMPAVLTKTIKEGNGLNATGDILQLHTAETLSYINGLGVNLSNCIDNNTIIEKNNVIQVNTDAMVIASNQTQGVVKIDEETIKTDNRKSIYVDVNNLEHATNSNYGVVKIDNKTISINNNGCVEVNTDMLDKATNNNFGIVKIDNTLNNDNKLNVVTNNLDEASNDNYGILKADEKTINIKNGVLSINNNGLDKASYDTFGIIKFNKKYFDVKNGIVTYKDYDNIINELNICESKIKNIKSNLYY